MILQILLIKKVNNYFLCFFVKNINILSLYYFNYMKKIFINYKINMMNNQNDLLTLNKKSGNLKPKIKRGHIPSSISLKSGINKIFIVFY